MPTLPDFDELNEIKTTFENEIYGSINEKKIDRKKCEDIIFDLLTLSYLYGLEVAGLGLERDLPLKDGKMREAISAKTAGKDCFERMNDHIAEANAQLKQAEAGGDVVAQTSASLAAAETLVNQLSVLAETEAGRVLNTAILDAAEDFHQQNPNTPLYKTWVTMDDDRVRDPHWVLHGSKVPYDAYFYTDGAKALRPHGFGVPELDVNCRCVLSLSTT